VEIRCNYLGRQVNASQMLLQVAITKDRPARRFRCKRYSRGIALMQGSSAMSSGEHAFETNSYAIRMQLILFLSVETGTLNIYTLQINILGEVKIRSNALIEKSLLYYFFH
jgi:hypothetical protein